MSSQMRAVDGRSYQEDDDTVTVNGGMMSGQQGHSLAAPPRPAPGFKSARPGKSLPGSVAPQASAGHDAGADSSGEQESSRGEEHGADEVAGMRRLKRLRAP